MKIKCLSFSAYKTKLKSYVFSKLDLFEFLFTQIALKENLDRESKFIDCLNDLDIKEDLYYLFNNVYYKFKDNHVIDCLKEDIYEVQLKDLNINPMFKEYLNKGLFPTYKGSIEKEFSYDYLNSKLVTPKENYDDSNIMCFSVSNSMLEVENLINKFASSLFNDKESVYVLENMIANPYYFEVELHKENEKLVYKRSHKEELYDNLVASSLFINDEVLEGEYLSSNIYFPYVYSNKEVSDNCKYLFSYDPNREFEVDNNTIYVSYKFEDFDFIDLVNKEGYSCGVNLLENNKKISTFTSKRENKVSEFKLYLIKNKDKFKFNVNEVIDAI